MPRGSAAWACFLLGLLFVPGLAQAPVKTIIQENGFSTSQCLEAQSQMAGDLVRTSARGPLNSSYVEGRVAELIQTCAANSTGAVVLRVSPCAGFELQAWHHVKLSTLVKTLSSLARSRCGSSYWMSAAASAQLPLRSSQNALVRLIIRTHAQSSGMGGLFPCSHAGSLVGICQPTHGPFDGSCRCASPGQVHGVPGW